MLVYHAMSTHVVAITPEEPAAQAASDLIEREITGLPVIDQDGHVLGVVTDLDLLRALCGGADLRHVTVAEVMDARPLFVGPETDLYTAVDLMDEWQVRRLPVCAGRQLVGVVSRGDILATLVGCGPPRRTAVSVG